MIIYHAEIARMGTSINCDFRATNFMEGFVFFGKSGETRSACSDFCSSLDSVVSNTIAPAFIVRKCSRGYLQILSRYATISLSFFYIYIYSAMRKWNALEKNVVPEPVASHPVRCQIRTTI